MLLMVEKVIRGGIFQAIYRYAKASNKYINNYDKSIESSYLMYLDASKFYGWAMSPKLPINGFKQVKDSSKFNESFRKNYDENSDGGYFLEVDVEYRKNLFQSHKDLPFLAERKELINTHIHIPFLPKRKKIRKSRKACLSYRRQGKIYSS